MGFFSTVSSGARGTAVKTLQKHLNQNGYKLDEDGIFGAKTKAALMDFQKSKGLTVDGIAGKNTWGALTSGASSGNTSSNANTEASAPTYKEYKAPEFKVSDATSSAETSKKKAENAVTNYGDFTYGKQGDLDKVIDSILNRKEFSYDLNGDALYQQYKDKYIQQGKLAMGDAIGQASAMTGGYGNSYAQSVGQQAYQAQLQNLNDIVPELYQMALDKYNREGDDLYNQYSMLSNDKNTQYGMWGDQYNRLVADRDYASSDYYNKYGIDWEKYNTDVGIGQTEHQNAFNAAYQKWADAQSQANWEKEYALNERQVKLQEKQYEDSKKTVGSGGDSSGGTSKIGSVISNLFGGNSNKNNSNDDDDKKSDTKYDYNYVLAQVKDDVRNGEDRSSIYNYLRSAFKAGYITEKQYNSLMATYVPHSETSGSGGHYTY